MERSDIFDVRTENAVISCILTDPQLFYEVELSVKEFNNPATRDIYSVISECVAQADSGKKALDLSPMQIQLMGEKMGVKISTSDIIEIRSLTTADGIVEIDSFSSYVQDMKDTGLRLRLYDAAEMGKRLALNNKVDAVEALIKTEGEILGIEHAISGRFEPKPIYSGSDIQIEECRSRAASGEEPGVMLGWSRFDQATGGCRPGSLTTIGARAKTGKSLLAANACVNIWRKYGGEIPILYLDSEMSTQEVRLRLWGIMSGINYRKIESGDLNSYEWAKLEKANKEMKSMNLQHLYMPSFDPTHIPRLVRKWRNTRGMGIVIFDYIKLPDDSSLNNKQEWQSLGFLTNTLKNQVAGELQLPVLTFCQLNRSGVDQAKKGEIDETSVGGSDRIVQYSSTFAIFRKASEKEMNATLEPGMPEWKRYGKHANRYMHICNTRCGGDTAPPIPMFLNDNDVSIIESGDIIPHGGNQRLSVTVGNQIATSADSSTES